MKPNHFTDYDEDVDVLENQDIVKKIIAFHGKFLLFYDNNFIYN